MQSCGEAYYKLTVCHQHGLDRDNDGIPCEVVCGDDIGTLQARLRHEGMTLAQPPAQAEPPALLQGDAVAHPEAPPPAAPEPETAQRDVAPVAACTGKRRCKQMLSCAEARFYLTQCGVTSLDADRDGVPCESLCQGR